MRLYIQTHTHALTHLRTFGQYMQIVISHTCMYVCMWKISDVSYFRSRLLEKIRLNPHLQFIRKTIRSGQSPSSRPCLHPQEAIPFNHCTHTHMH